MKKLTLAALIIGGFAAQAQAQSNVTIYGIADAGIVGERGGAAGSVTKLTSGVGNASRIGFRGTEDLGGGNSAIFQLEAGTKIDTGENDSALFQRQAFVGLKSKDMGTVTVGRQYTMLYNVLSKTADPFGAGFAGNAKNLFATGGAGTRVSNSLLYTTPSFQGFSADVQYGFGEQAGDNTAGRQLGLAVNYAQGPLKASVVYNNKNNDTAAVGTTPAVRKDRVKNTLFAANYDFGIAKAYFGYEIDKGAGSSPLPVANAFGYKVAPKSSADSTTLLLGVGVKAGTGTVLASYVRKDDKQNNQDANQFGIGYLHPLSKRTDLYAMVAKMSNKNGAGYTIGNNTEAGSGDRAYNLGVRHTF
ncbi:porin [Pseudoduganella guangdongensis]|uniref:porin n=1 Tax=Pseudoduganella guangdongensis TaxID=2692179 RepID=UPI003530BA24